VPDARPVNTGKAAAIRFVTGPAGIVANVDVPALDDGLLEVRAYVKPGDETTGYSSSLDRFGHVIASGATRAEADDRADEAIARFHVDIEPAADVLYAERKAV
jgi:predicted RNase H-like HicB family nuclease